MTERDSQPGGDPIGDLQRWLMRSGARSVTRDLTGQMRRALGQEPSGKRADVWETATTRPVHDEAPVCLVPGLPRGPQDARVPRGRPGLTAGGGR